MHHFYNDFKGWGCIISKFLVMARSGEKKHNLNIFFLMYFFQYIEQIPKPNQNYIF